MPSDVLRFDVLIPPALEDELRWWPPSARVQLLERLEALAQALARFEAQSDDAHGPARRKVSLYVGRLCAQVEVQPEAGRVEVRALGQVSVVARGRLRSPQAS